MTMMFSIVGGQWWSEGMIPYVGYKKTLDSPTTLSKTDTEATFSGIISTHPMEDGSNGFISFCLTREKVTNLKIKRKVLSFDRKYPYDEKTMHYKFSSQNGKDWIGTWKCKGIGSGPVKCHTDEIPDNFFIRPTV